MLILALSTMIFGFAANHPSMLNTLVILAIMGIGMGLAFSSLNTGITTTVSQHDVGMASGVFLMIGLMSNALGVLVSTVLFEKISYLYLENHLSALVSSPLNLEQVEKIKHGIAYFDSTSMNLSAVLQVPNDVLIKLFSEAMSSGIESAMLLSALVSLASATVAAALIGKK